MKTGEIIIKHKLYLPGLYLISILVVLQHYNQYYGKFGQKEKTRK
jgi:hypothetical protein